jgi:phage FluMu gp28-like protein
VTERAHHSELLDGDFALAAIPAVLLSYQQRWVDDDSPLKIAEKSRRIGLTWAEASDDVLEAAREGGSNTFYIGPTQDMALEFIEACAMWARAYDYAASQIEEGIFDDGDKQIKTYKIDFPATGRRIVALSSRPTNLRGKQGNIVIDEAAFHNDLAELLKAAMAMLLWGNKVRVVSTHDGEANPFNELIQDIRAGKRKGTIHRITFRDAVAEGLYRRVCLRRGIAWTPEGEAQWVADAYAFYGDAAAEELDVIPSQGTGSYLPRSLIERCMDAALPVLVWRCKPEFTYAPESVRIAECEAWCDEHLAPLLDALEPNLRAFYGSDFGRSGDASIILPAVEDLQLNVTVPFIVEMRNVPFQQQKQVLGYIIRRLKRFAAGAMDATGNGAEMAEWAAQTFGSSRVAEVKLSVEWYRQNMPRLKAAFEDATLRLPRHANTLADLRAVKMAHGVAQVPKDAREKGADGEMRHGDIAVALALLLYAIAEMEPVPIEFESAGRRDTFQGFGGGYTTGARAGNDFEGFL